MSVIFGKRRTMMFWRLNSDASAGKGAKRVFGLLPLFCFSRKAGTLLFTYHHYLGCDVVCQIRVWPASSGVGLAQSLRPTIENETFPWNKRISKPLTLHRKGLGIRETPESVKITKYRSLLTKQTAAFLVSLLLNTPPFFFPLNGF